MKHYKSLSEIMEEYQGEPESVRYFVLRQYGEQMHMTFRVDVRIRVNGATFNNFMEEVFFKTEDAVKFIREKVAADAQIYRCGGEQIFPVSPLYRMLDAHYGAYEPLPRGTITDYVPQPK